MKRRPDGRWQKRITLPNGKTKLLYSSAASERLANKDFNEQMLSLRQAVEDSMLFENVASVWEEEHFSKMQNNTLKQYRPCLRAAMDFFKGHKINEIKPLHIQSYVDFLTSQGFAHKTVKNRLLVVSLVFKFALLNELTDRDPTLKISIPKNLPKTKRENASKEDEKKICSSTNSLFGTLAYLYLTTGCRRGEAVALTPSDVNLQEKYISITKTVEWIGSVPQIKKSPKTDAGIRTIPISDKLVSLLLPLMKQKYLFPNEKGELLDNSQFTRGWNKYKKEAGISCTPHQLRHSYATILFDAGIDVKTAQCWLGHADINTTLGIYTHLSEQKQNESIQKLNCFLTTF
ncbi:MAG: tyrosine-type recombinase/integrase [Ruminococcus bromii]|nr:tyrosine-type recombinase/integrase [Ruminococcus bromii]